MRITIIMADEANVSAKQVAAVDISTDSIEMIDVRLKRLRDQCLLSQAELAERSGVPLATIKDIEGGKTARPHNKTIRKLSTVLEVTPQFLLHGEKID